MKKIHSEVLNSVVRMENREDDVRFGRRPAAATAAKLITDGLVF